MKTGVPVHRVIAVVMRTDFYACSRHIRYVRGRRLHLSDVLEGQGWQRAHRFALHRPQTQNPAAVV